MHRTTRIHRILCTTTVALITSVLIPAVASAATITLQDDAGNDVDLNAPATISNMSTKVGVKSNAGEDFNYTITVTGPGDAVVRNSSCLFVGLAPRDVGYLGNGAYNIVVRIFARDDFSCATPTRTLSGQYVVNASVGVGAPAAPFVIRQANTFQRTTLSLPFRGNVGALSYEVRIAKDAVVAPDGGLAGPSEEAFVDRATNSIPLTFPAPGTYVLVARAKGFSTAAGQGFTGWSPPVTIKAMTPFDLTSLTFTDKRGPAYRVRGLLYEASVTGKVSIAIRRGNKGRYRSIGTATIRNGQFSKRLMLRRRGTYGMRIIYRGSETVTAGRVESKFRIARRRVSH